MDQLLLATYSLDFLDYRTWAETMGCGLELHTFTEPAVLAGDLPAIVARHKRQLRGFRGRLGLHGAFYDMVSASLDPEIVAVTRKRYRQNLQTAAALDAQYVVFHANYMGGFKLPNYRPGWHQRQLDFWGPFTLEAASHGLVVLLENMWAPEPEIIADLIRDVNSPNLRSCLDIAHATLFSSLPIQRWIEVLSPYLYCCHLNNHDGQLDLHLPLTQGVVDYAALLPQLRRLAHPPLFTLELPDRASIEASLCLLHLPQPGCPGVVPKQI
ncbi:MAG: sugar phosphate isomerase/epimerase [Ardenticatenaceae bacterium]|nr:sugar phosphate isomerase/epimerase [Ardenticatenaceae bacterium]